MEVCWCILVMALRGIVAIPSTMSVSSSTRAVVMSTVSVAPMAVGRDRHPNGNGDRNWGRSTVSNTDSSTSASHAHGAHTSFGLRLPPCAENLVTDTIYFIRVSAKRRREQGE